MPMNRAAALRRSLDIPLILIALLAAFLNGYDIWSDKYANTYYTTAVAAMLENFHNFFFVSLDSAGSVTVDKPPVAFWIQALFAKIFGLHGWSVILPQALAGVGSVLLLYKLIKPTFGVAAARIAALAMAVTPIAASVSRTNNIDAMLVFALLVATALLFRGIRTNSVYSVVGSFAVVGVAFNMKMLQAYMVLPAFLVLLMLAAGWSWKKKAAITTGSVAALLLVSVSWAVVVDSVPADKRPYIGSSGTNSVMNLAFGYNGVQRLTGEQGRGGAGGGPGFGGNGTFFPEQGGAPSGPNGDGNATGNGRMNGSDAGAAPNGGVNPGVGPNGGAFPGMIGGPNGGRAGGMFGTGAVGPLRLFQSELSGQASWLLPFALFGAVALLASLRRRNWTDQHKMTLFWLAWLVPVAGFFSVAEFFHQYYLIMLAPPVAALTGAGFGAMWQTYLYRNGWQSWLLPAAVLATAGFEWYIVHPYDDTIGGEWSTGIVLAGLAIAAVLVAWRARESDSLSRVMAVAGMLVLLVGPVYWAATPITYGQNSMLPQAGPGSASEGSFGGAAPAFAAMRGGDGAAGSASGGNGWQSNGDGGNGGNPQGDGRNGGNPNGGNPGGEGRNGGNGFGGRAFPGMPGAENGASVDEALYDYLKASNTSEQYLMAVADYNTAAPYMIDKGESVVILNGFNGSDQVYTVEKLQALVASGKVKYFLLGGGRGFGGGGRGENDAVTEWIRQNGKEIPASEYGGATATSGNNADNGGDTESSGNGDGTAASGNNADNGGVAAGGFGSFGGGATLYEVTPSGDGAAS